MKRKVCDLGKFMDELQKRHPGETEFHQSVCEVMESVIPWYRNHNKYHKANILERLTEPDRIISFRVSWENDKGEIEINRGWRVQFSNALGPYKGGLRLHPTVNQSVLKFLAFEQILKNSLTGLPMGGGKGGSNFDPRGKSDNEVMRFCHSFMKELHRHIGEHTDIPAGDTGVSQREIGYLFGEYMRLENRWSSVLTGKGLSYGGSLVRTESTGYGCVYFLEEMLNAHDEDLKGKKIVISGSGNVARYTAEKAVQKGAKVIALSDSDGVIELKSGLSEGMIKHAHDIKENKRGRISEMADKYKSITFHKKANIWSIPCDVAIPCATQNELHKEEAETLCKNGVMAICEGANMPVTIDAIHQFKNSKILHAPGKAANAGGVAVSGLEISQNEMRTSWSREEIEQRLQKIMKDIHASCAEYGGSGNQINYIDGANIAGFKKVADALLSYGVV